MKLVDSPSTWYRIGHKRKVARPLLAVDDLLRTAPFRWRWTG